MKTLHTLAFYALVTPAITLSSASLLAQQPTEQDVDRDARSTEYDRDEQETQWKEKSDSMMDTHSNKMGDHAQQHHGFLSAAPENGVKASDLIGAEVATTADENLGSVVDLIIDENGQVVAVAVSVGGFLGLGERDVAIGWDDVTRSGDSDEVKLRANVTRDSVRDAPEYITQE